MDSSRKRKEVNNLFWLTKTHLLIELTANKLVLPVRKKGLESKRLTWASFTLVKEEDLPTKITW